VNITILGQERRIKNERRSERVLQKEVAVCLRNHYPVVSPHATCTKITLLFTITHFFRNARAERK
jgi:hypothetical protein